MFELGKKKERFAVLKLTCSKCGEVQTQAHPKGKKKVRCVFCGTENKVNQS